MSEISFDQLFAEAGTAAPRLRQILTETAFNLLESRLIVKTDVWYRASESDTFAKQFLTDLLGDPRRNSWDEEKLLGDSALGTLRAVNGRVHVYRASKGAARYETMVADAQGGMFCSMCGRREGLVVDHIEPVATGGADVIRNMQLLCIECNSGKSDLRDRALSIAVRKRITPVISAGLRFKHLLMDSVCVNGRTRGVCDCGMHANAVQLRVEVWPSQAAANLLNLRTRCTNCD